MTVLPQHTAQSSTPHKFVVFETNCSIPNTKTLTNNLNSSQNYIG